MEVIIVCALYTAIYFICKFISKNYKMYLKKINLENSPLKIDGKNIEFAGDYFDLANISDVSKKVTYKGIYNPITDKVKLINLKDNVSYSSINTILHEYKHKKDRLFLLLAEILTYILLINITFYIIRIDIYLPQSLNILFCVYCFLTKTIAEYRALRFSYIKMVDFTEPVPIKVLNRIVIQKTIIDGCFFLICYGSFVMMYIFIKEGLIF